jgi:hypothetical protein
MVEGGEVMAFMRPIFRKLYRHQILSDEEYSALMHYAEDLRASSPQSYALFYERFALLLFQDHYTYLPRFAYGMDDFYNFILKNPDLIEELRSNALPLERFPRQFHEYLRFAYGEKVKPAAVLPRLEFMQTDNTDGFDLPEPRRKGIICKYEGANPYKEIGLKSHFGRISRYSFVSRLQSVRYLRGNKAREDKIEVLGADCLGGIFTNKEKSIYYYIFLTEQDLTKANNACRVLNEALYGNYTGE